jgi:predicted metal-dependent hydrolase
LPILPFESKNDPIRFDLVRRTGQKHINIRVHHDGRVTVSAPVHASDERVEEAIRIKRNWILKHVDRVREKIGGIDELSGLPLSGIPHRVLIEYDSSRRGRIRLDETTRVIHLRTPTKSRKARLESLSVFLKKQCAATIPAEVDALARLFKIKLNRVFFRNQKTRWGSSSSRGNVSFNFRIALLPPQVRRYLIIHELIHQLYMNHSDEYWRHVAKVCPDYQTYDLWLKDHAYYLGLFR